jgi:hypothetical protein
MNSYFLVFGDLKRKHACSGIVKNAWELEVDVKKRGVVEGPWCSRRAVQLE